MNECDIAECAQTGETSCTCTRAQSLFRPVIAHICLCSSDRLKRKCSWMSASPLSMFHNVLPLCLLQMKKSHIFVSSQVGGLGSAFVAISNVGGRALPKLSYTLHARLKMWHSFKPHTMALLIQEVDSLNHDNIFFYPILDSYIIWNISFLLSFM